MKCWIRQYENANVIESRVNKSELMWRLIFTDVYLLAPQVRWFWSLFAHPLLRRLQHNQQALSTFGLYQIYYMHFLPGSAKYCGERGNISTTRLITNWSTWAVVVFPLSSSNMWSFSAVLRLKSCHFLSFIVGLLRHLVAELGISLTSPFSRFNRWELKWQSKYSNNTNVRARAWYCSTLLLPLLVEWITSITLS